MLRGPFSTLYGNASGGVIAVFTEDPTPAPVVDFAGSVGSYDDVQRGREGDGHRGRRRLRVAGNHFDTDGYREHSAATRDVVNAKLVFNARRPTRA